VVRRLLLFRTVALYRAQYQRRWRLSFVATTPFLPYGIPPHTNSPSGIPQLLGRSDASGTDTRSVLPAEVERVFRRYDTNKTNALSCTELKVALPPPSVSLRFYAVRMRLLRFRTFPRYQRRWSVSFVVMTPTKRTRSPALSLKLLWLNLAWTSLGQRRPRCCASSTPTPAARWTRSSSAA